MDDLSGHITVPLDFLLYLYPPLHMCAGDCKASATGIPTFLNPSGKYGNDRRPQCAICGGGDVDLASVYNPNACDTDVVSS
jgi:hypothetical protein